MKIKLKKVIDLVLNSLIILLIIGLGYLIFQDFNSIKNFTVERIYYPIINPKAGALAYEKEYKLKFDKAEKLRQKANVLVSKMQVEALKPSDRNVSDINKEYNIQRTDIFNEREQLLNELIEIDNKSLKLALPSEYQDFYNQRLKADMNEYDAFTDYRQAMETLSKGMILYEFDENYAPTMDVLVDIDALTKDSIPLLELNRSRFETFYNSQVTPLINEGFFTKDLADSLELKLKTMRVISGFQIARLNEDYEEADKYYLEISNMADTEPGKSSVEMFLDWSQEKVQPYYYTQDEKHKKSFSLFNEAYKYATNKNLNEIVSIWNGDYPGSAAYVPEKPTYKL